MSEKGKHVMMNLDSLLEIRGRGCSSTFQNRGELDTILHLQDVDKLASTKISINYESAKNLLRKTNINEIHVHKGSWIEKIFNDFMTNIEENVETNDQSDRAAALIEHARKRAMVPKPKEVQVEYVDYNEEIIEHNQTESVRVEETVVIENSEVELSLDDNEVVDIIEIEISNDDESVNEDIFEVNFPFDEALDVEDPYEIFKKIGDDFVQESENKMSDFRQMMWVWKDEIDRRWIKTENSNEKIILIAAHQYLIDKNKQLDKIGKFQISSSEKREHGRRAKSVIKDLFNRKYKWANRAIM